MSHESLMSRFLSSTICSPKITDRMWPQKLQWYQSPWTLGERLWHPKGQDGESVKSSLMMLSSWSAVRIWLKQKRYIGNYVSKAVVHIKSRTVTRGVDFGHFKRGKQRFQSCIIAGVRRRGARVDERAQPRVRGALVNLGSNLLGTSTRSLLGL